MSKGLYSVLEDTVAVKAGILQVYPITLLKDYRKGSLILLWV